MQERSFLGGITIAGVKPVLPDPGMVIKAAGFERSQTKEEQLMSGERVVHVDELGPSQYLKLIWCGEMDADLLDGLDEYVQRQKKRLGIVQKSGTPKEGET